MARLRLVAQCGVDSPRGWRASAAAESTTAPSTSISATISRTAASSASGATMRLTKPRRRGFGRREVPRRRQHLHARCLCRRSTCSLREVVEFIAEAELAGRHAEPRAFAQMRMSHALTRSPCRRQCRTLDHGDDGHGRLDQRSRSPRVTACGEAAGCSPRRARSLSNSAMSAPEMKALSPAPRTTIARTPGALVRLATAGGQGIPHIQPHGVELARAG